MPLPLLFKLLLLLIIILLLLLSPLYYFDELESELLRLLGMMPYMSLIILRVSFSSPN